jgi:hypothetical protein
LCPLNGLSPDLVTVHELEPDGAAIDARKDLSHLSVTGGHLPLVVYVTRALNVWVAVPRFGVKVRDWAANAERDPATTTHANRAEPMSARTFTLRQS